MRYKNLKERIEKNVKIDKNGCWIWQLCVREHGYGSISPAKRVHRVSYEVYKGKIPEGLCIDHLCRVRSCVNPEHLEAVTQRENLLRSPFALAGINMRKKKCKKGHAFSKKNTFMYFNKKKNSYTRMCKKCN